MIVFCMYALKGAEVTGQPPGTGSILMLLLALAELKLRSSRLVVSAFTNWASSMFQDLLTFKWIAYQSFQLLTASKDNGYKCTMQLSGLFEYHIHSHILSKLDIWIFGSNRLTFFSRNADSQELIISFLALHW